MHRHGKDKLAALQNLFANSRVLRHSEYTFIAMISVKPMVWAIPSLAWPQSPSYNAANYYHFDYRGIKGDEKITFILKKPGGEKRFEIDLSKYD